VLMKEIVFRINREACEWRACLPAVCCTSAHSLVAQTPSESLACCTMNTCCTPCWSPVSSFVSPALVALR
jgi:hypothetical protein